MQTSPNRELSQPALSDIAAASKGQDAPAGLAAAKMLSEVQAPPLANLPSLSAQHQSLAAFQNKAAHDRETAAHAEEQKKSRDSLGNAVADGAIILGGVGAAYFTHGASLRTLATAGLAGAATKIGTKALISGRDYDHSAGHLLADGASGAVEAATMLIGPQQVGKLFGMTLKGEGAAAGAGSHIWLNAGAGAIGGGATGTVEGMTTWDRQKSFADNCAEIGRTTLWRGATGAILAGAMTGFLNSAARYGKTDAASAARLEQSAFVHQSPYRNLIEEKFAPLPVADRIALRRQVASELKEVRAGGSVVDAAAGKSRPASAFDSLLADPKMSTEQKQNVLYNLGVVREHLASYRVGERMHPDPEVNWIHTMGEAAKVLEADTLKRGSLTARELEDTMLASMYSDSVKFSAPAPEGTTPNFHTHHIEGALAAQHSLRLQGHDPERIEGIVDAILAHQEAPPKFMGQLYYIKIKGSMEAMIKDGKIGAAEGEEMRKTLKEMSTVGEDGITRITKVADIQNAPVTTLASGRQQVVFTPAEQKVFALSGTDSWTVPYNPARDAGFARLSQAEQKLRISRGKIADRLIDADCADNYATTGGASKIVAIRGPKTFFEDKTVWDSIKSIDSSFSDAYTVMTPTGKALADSSRAQLNAVTNPADGTLKKFIDNWLVSTKEINPATTEVAFYNHPLTYPKGEMTPGQSRDMELAQEIRAQVVDFLRRDHRTGNDLPGNFLPVRH